MHKKMVYALCVKKYLTYAIDAFQQVYLLNEIDWSLGQGEHCWNIEKHKFSSK